MKKLYPYDKFINEGVRDFMTPKSPEEIEQAMRNAFNKTHMGWYEEYLKIKPIVDEACDYIKTTEYKVTTPPTVFDYNTGRYGFRFNNNFLSQT